MRTSMDENLLRARTRDLADQCDRQHRITQTCFLTPAELTIARAAAQKSGVSFKTHGGYEGAERRILIFVPDYLAEAEPDWDEYLHVLHITVTRDGLEHRDYLGAILALGMRRDQIGDILVSEKSAQIVILAGISEYLSLNMERIGAARVKIVKEPLSDLTICVPELIILHGNVSSLRLDNVASEGFSLQRSEITELIRGGQVNLNYVQEQRPDHTLKPGDLISLRGFGRVRFVSMDGKSRKDRFIITMEKTK
ncbi:MAG: YlmH/Sll1252 family protein [Eubacteriales bacterium]